MFANQVVLMFILTVLLLLEFILQQSNNDSCFAVIFTLKHFTHQRPLTHALAVTVQARSWLSISGGGIAADIVPTWNKN